MNSKYKQSREELEQHLKDTIQALELSSQAYDNGFEGESKRCAASIRVLVHDTSGSKSLLGQLGQKDIAFYDTSFPRTADSTTSYIGLAAVNLIEGKADYKAVLDNLPPDLPPRWVTFDEWWNGIIFVDQKGFETTRKDLILSVANKDGGAHVDPKLDEKYANLSRQNSLGWHYSGPRGNTPLRGPEKAATRQITHEMLKSLTPDMPKIVPKVEGVLAYGMSATVRKAKSTIPKVGRNELCPCGSGKKYKRCHGASNN